MLGLFSPGIVLYSGSMKVTQVRWLLLGLLVFWLIVCIILPGGPRTIGISSESVNGEYRFSAGTEPAWLGFSVLMIGSYLLLINTQKSESNGPPISGVFRRLVAFWLDMVSQ
jgi:hypothetical protein